MTIDIMSHLVSGENINQDMRNSLSEFLKTKDMEVTPYEIEEMLGRSSQAGANLLMGKIAGDESISDEEITSLELNMDDTLAVLASVRGVVNMSVFNRDELHQTACKLMESEYKPENVDQFVMKFSSVNMAIYDMLESAIGGECAIEWNKYKQEQGAKVLYQIDYLCSNAKLEDYDDSDEF
jgi:hypothetical protein